MESSFQTGGADRHWLYDPQNVDSIGPILNKLVTYDTYFEEEEGVSTLTIVLDKILDELPKELEEAVRLTFLAGMTYRSAGRTLGVDHKTVKSRSQKGVAILRKRLTDTVWLAALLQGMIPEEPASATLLSPEKVFNVLGGISNVRSNYEG